MSWVENVSKEKYFSTCEEPWTSLALRDWPNKTVSWHRGSTLLKRKTKQNSFFKDLEVFRKYKIIIIIFSTNLPATRCRKSRFWRPPSCLRTEWSQIPATGRRCFHLFLRGRCVELEPPGQPTAAQSIEKNTNTSSYVQQLNRQKD